MATQKEKLVKATQMAMRIKSIASRLRHDAKDYDVRFHWNTLTSSKSSPMMFSNRNDNRKWRFLRFSLFEVIQSSFLSKARGKSPKNE